MSSLFCSFIVNIVKNLLIPDATVKVAGDFNIDLIIIDNVSNLNCLTNFINNWGYCHVCHLSR